MKGVFQSGLTSRGISAWILGLILTLSYTMIYFGGDISLRDPDRVDFLLDDSGRILGAKGEAPGSAVLARDLKDLTRRIEIPADLDRKFQEFTASGRSELISRTGRFYFYELKFYRVKPGEIMLQITITDTAHHFLTRHVYSRLDPLARLLRNSGSDNWFFYSTMYTLFVLVFGVRMFRKHRGNRYQIYRTISVMFFQLGFAYLLPGFLALFQQPDYYFSYFWPLKPEYLYPSYWKSALGRGGTGVLFLSISACMTFFATPVLTYFYGKRWYCSWVCGCGGLAETAGDPFRHLSDKSPRAWKLEIVLIYSVLGLITAVTGLLWANSLFSGEILGRASAGSAKAYGFFIGSIWSGVIGVGFYPILGSRVWCRFGCPMAAYLGILQKYFSRFRITTNGGQCISCGNCSTYCEMGIDVRSYAQRGEDIVRASCVGCGICSAVCPRGVLNLETR